MLEERLNYLYIISTDNDSAKSLPYEVDLKVHAPKKCIESTVKVCQAAN